MDIEKFLEQSMAVTGAVTHDDAVERLSPGTEVVVVLDTKNLALISGTVVGADSMTVPGGEDVRVTVSFKGNGVDGSEKGVIQSMMLCGMLNGKTAAASGGGCSTMTRLFTSFGDAVAYFNQVQFVREVEALERASSVSSFISRLLSQRQKPPRT